MLCNRLASVAFILPFYPPTTPPSSNPLSQFSFMRQTLRAVTDKKPPLPLGVQPSGGVMYIHLLIYKLNTDLYTIDLYTITKKPSNIHRHKYLRTYSTKTSSIHRGHKWLTVLESVISRHMPSKWKQIEDLMSLDSSTKSPPQTQQQ